ncbi:MAG: hypothetical protein JWO19_2664 [Bryobacterales bacterium]|nr:hypothetical protein [Bryobacterales bacterium]
MPEQSPTLGALVQPRGFESLAVTSEEYGYLKTALSVIRRCDSGDLSYSVLIHLLIVEASPRAAEERDGVGRISRMDRRP